MPNQCPICERRRAKRFCPGLSSSRWSASGGTSICPQCCGAQREVSIDCPADCSYLIAAHRYEGERRQPPKELAFEKVSSYRRRWKPAPDVFVDYVKAGKESYTIVSSFDQFEYREEAPLFRRLSETFELCVYGLHLVKRDLERYQQDYCRRVQAALGSQPTA